MTTKPLDMAEALLAKARSTPYEHERDSFASGAQRQIEAYLRRAARDAEPDPDRSETGGEPAVSPVAAPVDKGRLRGRIIKARSDGRRTLTARSAYRSTGSADRPGIIIDLTL